MIDAIDTVNYVKQFWQGTGAILSRMVGQK